MRIYIDDTTKQVHLLGLDWGDIALLSTLLINTAVKTDRDEVLNRVGKIIDIIDAGSESLLNAHLELPE